MAEDDSGGWGYTSSPWPAPDPPGGFSPPPPGVVPLRPRARSGRLPVRPSPIFLGLVAAFVASGVLCAKQVGNPRIWVFVFVALGWTISLCLHEFAHAAAAWKAGDRSVEAKGYLTLNPVRYMNTQMSIVLPIIIVMIGGIPLPGGAVMVDRRLIREKRQRSLISAAGPLTNLACAAVCALPLATGLLKFSSLSNISLLFNPGHTDAFPSALAFLALIEVLATVINALPIPGFDGFGVIAPYLKDETVAQLMPIARFAWFGLFVILLMSATASRNFFGFCDHIVAALGVNSNLANYGQQMFTFWVKF